MATPKSLFTIVFLFLMFQVLAARMLLQYGYPPNFGGYGSYENDNGDNGQGKGSIQSSRSDHSGSETDGNSPPPGTVQTTPSSNGGTKMSYQHATNNGGGVQRVRNTGSGSQTAANSGGVQDVENNGHGAQHANNGHGVQQVINNGDAIQNADNNGNGVQQVMNDPSGSVSADVNNDGVKKVVNRGGESVTQQVTGDGVEVVTKDKDGKTHSLTVGPNGISSTDGNYFYGGNSSPDLSEVDDP